MSFNKVCIIGNLGNDAIIGKAGEKDVANFNVAVNEKRKGEEVVTWFRCALFGQSVANVGQYLVKGKMVYVEGPVSIEEYTNKETGVVHRNLKVFVNELKLLGGGKDKSEPKTEPKADAAEVNPFQQ